MGSCSSCSPDTMDRSIQMSRTSSTTSPDTSSNSRSRVTPVVPITVRTIGTSPVQTIMKSVGTFVKIETMRPGDETDFTPLPRHPLDITLLDDCVNNADFSNEVNQPIEIVLDKKTDSSKKPTNIKKNEEPHKENWEEKYFIHGEFSEIVAAITSKTHGCIKSSISTDVDDRLSSLYEINIYIDKFIKDRNARISSKEKQYVEELIARRDETIGRLLNDGCSYVEQYETEYRKILTEFIKKLEKDLSTHLDNLQREIEADKQTIFLKTTDSIILITKKATEAKKGVQERAEDAAKKKREEIMQQVKIICKDTTNQPLSYEQLRTLHLEIYSNVGNKKPGQGCKDMPEREYFIPLINNAAPHQPKTKRTVYLQSDFTK